mgnify:CR=1 FL=1
MNKIIKLSIFISLLFISSCSILLETRLLCSNGIYSEFQYKNRGMLLSIFVNELDYWGRMKDFTEGLVISTNGILIVDYSIGYHEPSDSMFLVYPDSMIMEFDGKRAHFDDLFKLNEEMSKEKLVVFDYRRFDNPNPPNPKRQRKKLTILPCNFIKHNGRPVICDTISWDIIY